MFVQFANLAFSDNVWWSKRRKRQVVCLGCSVSLYNCTRSVLLFHLALRTKSDWTGRPADHLISTQRIADFRPFFWKSRPGEKHSENGRFGPFFFRWKMQNYLFLSFPLSLLYIFDKGHHPRKSRRKSVSSWFTMRMSFFDLLNNLPRDVFFDLGFQYSSFFELPPQSALYFWWRSPPQKIPPKINFMLFYYENAIFRSA